MSYLDPQDRVVQRLPRGAIRPSPIFLGIVAAFAISAFFTWRANTPTFVSQVSTPARIALFVFVVTGWLLTLCLHEFAHAFVAYKSGDTTVVQRGYLQLNPLKYSHWLMSIVVPLLFILAGGIALPGGAVLINHSYVRSRARETAISLAGPAMNLLFTVALVAPFALGADLGSHTVFWSGAAFLAFLQLMASLFNLLPIPGLDGGGAIRPWLSPQWQRGFSTIAPFGFFIIILVMWQTSFGQTLLRGLQDILASFGVPGSLIDIGGQLFRFWQS